MRRRAAYAGAAVGALGVAALIAPDAAFAHGLVGKLDLPVPKWLFAWAASLVLIISFVALATMWPTPRLERARRTRLLWRPPRVLEPLCGAVGIALFAVVVYSGLAGEQFDEFSNLTPTFIFYLFWVGVPFLSLAFGDVFRAFNPWRAFARAIAWAATRTRGADGLPAPLPYPTWLGRWPAAFGILGFAWLELVYVNRGDPQTLAYLSLGYAAVMLIGMSLYGIEPWTTRADAFSVEFNLFARMAPLRWERDRLELRPPLIGIIGLEIVPGTIALVTAMIGSTSFDGFEQGGPWLLGLEPHLQSFFAGLGAGPDAALELASTVGLLLAWGFVSTLYELGIRGMQSIDPRFTREYLARSFVHTLVPIALAYIVAHYFSALVYEVQGGVALASDPLGNGSNLFGTANVQIDYNVLSPDSIWYVQIGALLLGHVCGLMLAHDRALVIYRRTADAVRSQYWMLAVMVAFTSLGLWLLSAAE